MNLVGDVLDKQVTDREREPLGKADGIILMVRHRLPPRVESIELGLVTLAGRLSPRLGHFVRRLERRLRVSDGDPVRLAFERIKSVGVDVHVDVDGKRTKVFAWENWWRQALGRIPGARDSRESKTET